MVLVSAAVAGVVTTAASPAAGSSHVAVPPTSFARTDSAAPHTTITTGDALVGAHRDGAGRPRISKSYLTFDVTRFRGTSVLGAEVNLLEIAANDCETARATEVWLTEPLRRGPTWATAPREILRLPVGGSPACPPTWLGVDMGDALRQALAAGWETMTVVLRVSERKQSRLAYGRTYEPDSALLVEYNSAPDTPTALAVAGKACGPDPLWVGAGDFRLTGGVSDPDGGTVSARVALWPVDDPANRWEVVYDHLYSSFSVGVPPDRVTDNGTYAWQVRAEDADGGVSAWTEPCRFTVDRTRPSAAPTVSSEAYPEGGGPPGSGGDGVPGDFTFTANGVADVVAFQYDSTSMGYGRVEADQPGGTATVSLTPRRDGPVDVTVHSIDRAGNRSAGTLYRFWVRATAPVVEVPWTVTIGEQLAATFAAVQDGATTFGYRVDEGPEVTVPVGPDGTAEVRIDTPTSHEMYYHTLYVWSANAQGFRSGVTDRSFEVDPARPAIEVEPGVVLLDQPVEVTFRPSMPGVVSYTYWTYWEELSERITVPAGPDGTARVTITPPGVGWVQLQATSTTAAGVESGAGWTMIEVDRSEPVVTSAEYPEDTESGAPGTAGTFHFAAPIPDVVEYRYTFEYEEYSVPAAGDGTATVTLTPAQHGYHPLTVYAVSASGRVTGAQYYAFTVGRAEPLVEGVPTEPVTIGNPVELVFTARQPGAVEFVYRTRGDDEVVVPVVDGKATVTVTASDPYGTGSGFVVVHSRTAEGIQSAEKYVDYPVIR